MTPSPLACTVRGCGLPLVIRPTAYVCPRGHAYDIARSGYVNLLQPQDRRSLVAGDTRATVEARLRLLEAGVGSRLVDACVEQAASLQLDGGIAIDLGCGTGDALAAVTARCGMAGIGIDLSTEAASVAARRNRRCTWVVANADRRLPLVDHSASLVLSVHARRHPLECARVLDTRGRLLVAVPADDDLAEVRRFVQGAAVSRDRSEAVVAEHRNDFTLAGRWRVSHTARRSRETVLDLLRVTYRAARASAAARMADLAEMEVTLSSDLLLFERRGS